MTIPQQINKYLRRSYLIKYTVCHDVIIKEPIKVTELVKLRRYLKGHKIDYRNIIVELFGGK